MHRAPRCTREPRTPERPARRSDGCRSYQRSKSSAAGLEQHVVGRTIALGRGAAPARRPAAHRRAPPTSRPRPAGWRSPRPAAAASTCGCRWPRHRIGGRGRAPRPPGDERPVAARRAGSAGFATCPDPVHVHRRRARPQVHRSADVRPHHAGPWRGRPARPRSRTSPPTRWSPRTTRRRCWPGWPPGSSGIKRALLDQSLVSGVGNIYADEALWRARTHWDRLAANMRRADATRLLAAVREVLTEALTRGRHLVRQPVRERQRGERLLRPVTGGVRARGRTVPAMRGADPA